MSHPNYRSDIDGLRAVAVIPVILYHAQVVGFSGGYIGVDIFFVISGFLITEVLLGSQRWPPRLALTNFYCRRGRRILPALFLTCAVTTVAAVVLLLPWDLQRYGGYLGVTTVFANNIAAWVDGADYFGSRVAYAPLTHLWSIAVEEQFYVLYPLLLLPIARLFPRYLFTTLATVALISFIVCVWASYYHPLANFFLAPTRAWELLLGALLTTTRMQWKWSRWVCEAVALLGLSTIAFLVHVYSSTMRYPGLYALGPCIAAALLILAGREHRTCTYRLLSRPAWVFGGKISFSLYLWHLPVLLLFAYYHITQISAMVMAALMAAICLLATLSWKFVEQPVRSRAVLQADVVFVKWAVMSGAALLLIGLGLWHSNGFPGRFPRELAVLDQSWMASSGSVMPCVNLPVEKIAAADLCSYGPQTDAAPKVLVWGDSHAMALLPAYEQWANARQLRIYFAVKPACKPLIGVANSADTIERQAGCMRFNTAALLAIEKLSPKLVILNAHWIGVDDLILSDDIPGSARGKSNFRRSLEYTLQALHSEVRTVCAVLDVPIFPYSVPYAVGMARRRGISEEFLTVRRPQAEAQFVLPERDFSELHQRGELQTTDLKDALCRGAVCLYEFHDELLYADRNHLSVAGARFVSGALAGCFRD